MFTISIIGNEDITLPLCSCLKYEGGVVCFSNNTIISYPDPHGFTKYAVINTDNLTHADIKSGIVLFCYPNIESLSNIQLSNSLTCITSEDDIKSLEFLRYNKNPALTCGMSLKSTITLSSFTDETAVVSLQREILNLNGFKVVPRDLTISLSKKTDSNIVMMIAAIFFLTCDSENNKDHIII